MKMNEARPGRPRRYDVAPTPGFANRDAAVLVASLDELSERLFDLIHDLPREGLAAVPESLSNSIAWLTLHMADAEAWWLARIPGVAVPDELKAIFPRPGRIPSTEFEASELVGICRRVREEITKPALAPVDDLDSLVVNHETVSNGRMLLMHLIWHWTYHTGQAGLLRRWVGVKYQWRFK
ncbi:MAG: DUF664 domain-containing protein [Candidatus Sumerlaeota bacterium]|nr:DUF664 domain-containing protein [Candidatus Sumerlaeota bacterium]